MTEAIMEFSVFPEWNTWKTAFSSFWPMGKYYNARNYDQMTGRFMQTDPVFAERRGFDSYDPYSYVASNPINFTDPSGASWLSQAAKGLGGKKFWGGVRNVIQGVVGLSMLSISPLIGIGYGLLNNPKAFLAKPLRAIGSYAQLGLDFSLGSFLNPLQGIPQPTIKHVPGGEIQRNSFIQNNFDEDPASTFGFVANFKTGEDDFSTIQHEKAHIRQSWTNWNKSKRPWPFSKMKKGDEVEADLMAGRIGYKETFMYLLLLESAGYLPRGSSLNLLTISLLMGNIK